MKALSLVILISGNGSNLQAIIDAIASNKLNATIQAVISNKAQAYGLTRATSANIASHVIANKDYSDKAAFDAALQNCIDQHNPDLIALAGFMRILSDDFVSHYHGKLINIHPSLLPKYPGLNTHERVLNAGEKYHGASIHFVTEQLDGGPVIAYQQLSVNQNDTPESLKARVHELEHQLYPQVLHMFSANKIRLQANKTLIDGNILSKNGINLGKD